VIHQNLGLAKGTGSNFTSFTSPAQLQRCKTLITTSLKHLDSLLDGLVLHRMDDVQSLATVADFAISARMENCRRGVTAYEV